MNSRFGLVCVVGMCIEAMGPTMTAADVGREIAERLELKCDAWEAALQRTERLGLVLVGWLWDGGSVVMEVETDVGLRFQLAIPRRLKVERELPPGTPHRVLVLEPGTRWVEVCEVVSGSDVESKVLALVSDLGSRERREGRERVAGRVEKFAELIKDRKGRIPGISFWHSSDDPPTTPEGPREQN